MLLAALNHSLSGKQKGVGGVLSEGIKVSEWEEEAPPILVVTSITKVEPLAVQLSALARPGYGLCTPCQIGQISVFYRHEFRDATTNIRDRGPAWNSLVKEYSARKIGTVDKPPTETQKRFQRARDPVRLVFNPNIVGKELLMPAAEYKRTKNGYILDEIKKFIEKLGDDSVDRIVEHMQSIRLFLDEGGELARENAFITVIEISTL